MWDYMCVDICVTVIYDGPVRLSVKVLMLAREYIPKNKGLARAHITEYLCQKMNLVKQVQELFRGSIIVPNSYRPVAVSEGQISISYFHTPPPHPFPSPSLPFPFDEWT